MTQLHKNQTSHLEKRFFLGQLILLSLTFLLTTRLWYLQVYRGERYVKISKNNRIRKIEIPAPRGLIFDKHHNIILDNKIFSDLVLIPQYTKDIDLLIKNVSMLIHKPYLSLYNQYKKNRGQAKFLPIIISKNLTSYEVSKIKSNQFVLPGIDIQSSPRRHYTSHTPAHLVGHLQEVNINEIKTLNKKNIDNTYSAHDLIGKSGLEGQWNDYLRGKKGYSYVQVDAHGRRKNILNTSEELRFLSQPAIPGNDLTLTIDKRLQEVAKKGFNNKYGAIIVLNPQNGEILTLLSSPSYNPEIYQKQLSIEKWQELINNPFKPFFDKTTGGVFPPASLYKPLVGIAALEEKIITPDTKHYCSGSFKLGNKTFHCHKRAGHGSLSLKEAMMKSCDIYFYKIGLELGISRLYQYANYFKLGQKLGLNLNKESSGYIPLNNRSYTKGDIPSLAIGQGATLLTPIQIATMYAAFATNGKIWEPYLVKKITNYLGEVVYTKKPTLLHKINHISKKNFRHMQDILLEVVQNKHGSGRRAQVKGARVAGKTGSAQVVSLDKNRNRQDIVSMKWQEHALFAAFSPEKNAEIVVVVSENDTIGGGSISAAPIAQKIIHTYWKHKEKTINFNKKL